MLYTAEGMTVSAVYPAAGLNAAVLRYSYFTIRHGRFYVGGPGHPYID